MHLRLVVASLVAAIRVRRAGKGPARAHLFYQDEGAQEPARDGNRCRGALLVRLVPFTERGRSRTAEAGPAVASSNLRKEDVATA